MAENNVKIIKNTITRLLAGRGHSQYGLLKKLLQRDFEYSLCVEWIEKFNQHNLQSELRFCESLFRGRMAKGIGELRIRNDLKQNQIPQQIVDAGMLEENPD